MGDKVMFNKEEMDKVGKKKDEDLRIEEAEEPMVRVVVTQRAKEVAWPPPDEKRAVSPGDLTGKVRFGQSRRKLMELEVSQFKGSSSHQMRTNPFSAGGFQPGKMKAEERWRPAGQKTEPQVEVGPRCTLGRAMRFSRTASQTATQHTGCHQAQAEPEGRDGKHKRNLPMFKFLDSRGFHNYWQ